LSSPADFTLTAADKEAFEKFAHRQYFAARSGVEYQQVGALERQNMFRVLLVLMVISAFALVGCRRGDLSIDREAGTINVTLSESDVNAAIEAALAAAENPLLRNPSVDLREGTLVVSGEHLRRDGSGQTVSGTVTFTPVVANNQLSISVTAVDIEGVALNDTQAQAFADRVAERINAAIARTVRVLEVSSLTVSDTGIEFALKRAE
jgi:hypothetical protein